MPRTRLYTFFRITGIVLLGLILTAIGVGIWLDGNYKRIIQQKLPAISAKATDTVYQIKAGDVNIDLIGRRVVITDFELVPDKEHIERLRRDFRLPELLHKIHIDRIVMEDIAWGEVLRTREIVCGSMEIHHPVVRIQKLADRPKDTAGDTKKSRIQAIKAGNISILNPDVRYEDGTARKATAIVAKGGRIDLSDWQYDLRQRNDSNRLFYASRTAINLAEFRIIQPDAFFRIGCRAFTYDQEGGKVTVRELSIVPALDEDAFYRRVGHQKEIYRVRFPTVSLEGLDWKALLGRGELIAEGARLADPSVHIYLSRIPPLSTEDKTGNFPQQLLMKLKLPVHIPRLDIGNGTLQYLEKDDRTRAIGTVTMTAINGSVRNITNMPAPLRRDNVCLIALKGQFKGSQVAAEFRLTINSKAGAFRVAGSLGPMEGTRLNDITRPLAQTEIQSLKLEGIRFELEGDQRSAKGVMRMPYKDLKTHLLEVEDGGMDKKDFSTFMANKLLVHPNNPEPGKELRVARPYAERDKTKSFFNLVWKTIFTGTLQSVSRKIVKLDKVVNKKQQKEDERRRKEEQDKSGR